MKNFVLLGFSVFLFAATAEPAFAGKGLVAWCRDTVQAKGLKGDAYKAEFARCRNNPQQYK